MQTLYTKKEQSRFEKRTKLSFYLSAVLFVLPLILSVVLCFFVNTETAKTLLTHIIFMNTLCGWAGIGIFYYVYLPSRAQAKHISRCIDAEYETYSGMVCVSKTAFAVPKSITVKKVLVETDEGPVTVYLNAAYAGLFPEGNINLRLLTASKYITAFEVLK